jgi:hypothetical protein
MDLPHTSRKIGTHSTINCSGVFQAQDSHVWARRCYDSKINKDKLIKVTIGLTELLREDDMSRCLLMSQGNRRIDNEIQKSSRGSKVVPTRFRIQRYQPLVENNGNK